MCVCVVHVYIDDEVAGFAILGIICRCVYLCSRLVFLIRHIGTYKGGGRAEREGGGGQAGLQ